MNLISSLALSAIIAAVLSCTQSAKMSGVSGLIPRKAHAVTSARRDVQASNIHKIWVVTSIGNAYRLTLEGEKVTETKKWTGVAGDGGSRTYVTEGGFVVARWPYVYFIDPDGTPEGALTSKDFVDISQVLPGESPNDPQDWQHPRICLASYQKSDNKRYLIAAWGNGRYREFLLSDNKPYRPDWSVLAPKKVVPEINGWVQYAKGYTGLPAGKGFDLLPSDGTSKLRTDWGWGYSCAINQKTKQFYSQWYSAGPKLRTDDMGFTRRTGGILNLETGVFQDPEIVAPNRNFVSKTTKLKDLTWGVSNALGQGSYAVGTDSDGNIYNGAVDDGAGNSLSVYTMAHDPIGDFMWVSMYGTTAALPKGKLTVLRRKCLTTEPNCVENKDFIEFPGPEGFIGPLSALKDGTIVGAVRRTDSGKHGIYLLRLEDDSDLTKGIRFKKLDFEVDGDPYMYVDFTGATLYTYESEQTFKIREIAGYAPRNQRDLTPMKILEVKFAWNNRPETTTEWRNIKLESRCYADASAKPAYETIVINAKAGEFTDITTKSCAGLVAEFIDVKLSKIKGENLSDVSDIQISVKQ